MNPTRSRATRFSRPVPAASTAASAHRPSAGSLAPAGLLAPNQGRTTARRAARVAIAATLAGLVVPGAAQAALRTTTVPRATPTGPETVLAWYDTTVEALKKANWGATGQTQIFATRTWVSAWGAAEDAALAAQPVKAKDGVGIARRVAVANAIHDVLISLAPAGKAIADAQLAATLESVPPKVDIDQPQTQGQLAAGNWISKRLGDNLDPKVVNAGWTPPPAAPGIWRATPPAFAGAVQAYQGQGVPFLINGLTTRFVAPEPPAIDSPTVIADLQEIDKLGSLNSGDRGPERTQIARFWSQSSVAGFQSILREALIHDASGVVNQLRIVKVFHEVTGDAQIAIYASKYKYNRWRPVTALTVDDGNPVTPYDPAFVPFLATPAHPEYPSGHVGYAAAAEIALKALIGPSPLKPIRAQSSATPGVFTAYTEWGEITDDNVNARVWEGIHLRSTNNLSRKYGYAIARTALKVAALRETKLLSAAIEAKAEAAE